MPKNIAFILLAAVILFVTARPGAGQRQNHPLNCGGSETVTLAASNCSQWFTITIDFSKATWAQTTINVPSCYDWWNGARTAEGKGLANRIEAGRWQVDPVTYEMMWQPSEPAGGIDAGQGYPLALTALSF